MKLMDGTSLLAHKKSTEQKIEDSSFGFRMSS